MTFDSDDDVGSYGGVLIALRTVVCGSLREAAAERSAAAARVRADARNRPPGERM